MTPADRRIATAALKAGPWATQEQIVIAVANALELAPEEVELVLEHLVVQQVLNRVRYREDSVVYEEGGNWTDEE